MGVVGAGEVGVVGAEATGATWAKVARENHRPGTTTNRYAGILTTLRKNAPTPLQGWGARMPKGSGRHTCATSG